MQSAPIGLKTLASTIRCDGRKVPHGHVVLYLGDYRLENRTDVHSRAALSELIIHHLRMGNYFQSKRIEHDMHFSYDYTVSLG